MESMESAGHSATILNTNKCIPAQQGEHVLLRSDQQGEHVLLRVGGVGMHFLVFRIRRAWELESGLQNSDFLVMRSDFSGRLRLPAHDLMGQENDSY